MKIDLFSKLVIDMVFNYFRSPIIFIFSDKNFMQ